MRAPLLLLGLFACSDYKLNPDADGAGGGDPGILVEPDILEWTLLVGQTVTGTVTVTSTGTGALTISDISAELPFSEDGEPTTLDPDSSLPVEVSFTGETLGLFIGELIVRSDDPDRGRAGVDLVAEVVEELPDTGTLDTGYEEPVTEESCNGVDDDGDGQIDEDYPDTDMDGIADCLDEEECDGLDNDGDGEIDEGFDTDGDGICDGEELSYTVDVIITVDDAYELYVDGAALGSDPGDWTTIETYTTTLESGDHVIAVHGYDVAAAISGFILAVKVDGTVERTTADAVWTSVDAAPSGAWTDVGYDDSAWSTPTNCTPSEASIWGSTASPLTSLGATWVWSHTCLSLGQGWFRTELSLP